MRRQLDLKTGAWPANEHAPYGIAEALSRLAASRDSEAWDVLLRLVGNDVMRVVCRLTGDAELTQDAMQETLLRVRDRAASFRFVHGEDADAAARRWILTMATNLAIDLARQRQRIRRHSARLSRQRSTAPHATHPDAALERAEQADLVRQELTQLPELSQRAIVMHHVSGMSFEEVAAELRIPIGTAKTWVRRGLQALRERLERHGLAMSLVALSAFLDQLPAAEAHFVVADYADLLTSSSQPKAAAPSAAWWTACVSAALILTALLWWTLWTPAGSPSPATTPPLAAEPSASTTAREFFVSAGGDDAADGSAQRPWATIQHAADRVGPGDTVRVAPGRYDAPVVIGTGGTAEARIRFVSTERWGATIDARADVVWTISRANYVDIEGFDISSSDPTAAGARFGILVEASHCRIVGNRIHDIPALKTLRGGMGGAGICCGTYPPWAKTVTTGNQFIGNIVQGIGHLGRPDSTSGIRINDEEARVWNNIVSGNRGAGIDTYHAATRVVIANNLVSANQRGGILIGAGDKPGGVVNDQSLVTNNIVIDNTGGPGVGEFGSTGARNLYLNNCIFGNTPVETQLRHGLQAIATVMSDPQFLAESPDQGIAFRLRSTSPCRDAGTPQGAPDVDFTGHPRLQGAAIDIGPLEAGP